MLPGSVPSPTGGVRVPLLSPCSHSRLCCRGHPARPTSSLDSVTARSPPPTEKPKALLSRLIPRPQGTAPNWAGRGSTLGLDQAAAKVPPHAMRARDPFPRSARLLRRLRPPTWGAGGRHLDCPSGHRCPTPYLGPKVVWVLPSAGMGVRPHPWLDPVDKKARPPAVESPGPTPFLGTADYSAPPPLTGVGPRPPAWTGGFHGSSLHQCGLRLRSSAWRFGCFRLAPCREVPEPGFLSQTGLPRGPAFHRGCQPFSLNSPGAARAPPLNLTDRSPGPGPLPVGTRTANSEAGWLRVPRPSLGEPESLTSSLGG